MPYMPSTVDIDPKAAKTVQNGYQARFERVKAFIASKEESSDLEEDSASDKKKKPEAEEKKEVEKSLAKIKHYLVYPHLGLKVELKTLKDYLNA